MLGEEQPRTSRSRIASADFPRTPLQTCKRICEASGKDMRSIWERYAISVYSLHCRLKCRPFPADFRPNFVFFVSSAVLISEQVFEKTMVLSQRDWSIKLYARSHHEGDLEWWSYRLSCIVLVEHSLVKLCLIWSSPVSGKGPYHRDDHIMWEQGESIGQGRDRTKGEVDDPFNPASARDEVGLLSTEELASSSEHRHLITVVDQMCCLYER